MNNVQSNKLTMYNAVIEVLNQFVTEVEKLAQFKASFDEFKNLMPRIAEKDKEKNGVYEGKTDDKLEMEEKLVATTVKIAAGLYAYGKKNSKNDILSISNVTASGLNRLKDNELISKSSLIYDTAKTVEAELAGYGLAADKLESLKNDITGFREAVSKRDAARTVRSEGVQTLREIFKEGDSILEDELDMFVESNFADSSELYIRYFNARNIIDRGKRKEKKVTEGQGDEVTK